MKHPFLLLPAGSHDADFVYATRFAVEDAAYLSFGEGDDILVTNALEIDRARQQARVARVLDERDLDWRDDVHRLAAWAGPVARLLRERGLETLRVGPRLPALLYESLRQAGIELEIDTDLLVSERRRKSREEQGWIHSAQRAAEAACVEVMSQLAAADAQDGLLWVEGRPLTSEHLMAAAERTLQEIGYEGGEMIIAGAPGCALPHFRGEGQLTAGAPIIIDIFPRGKTSGYFGDLTRTVIVGDVEERWRRMSDAVLAAFDAALPELRAGADGRAAHEAACRALVEAGYGTTTKGFAGPEGGAKMNHSLGHGVGLEIHEPPALRGVEYPLLEGDIVTVEPGLYELGAGGIRWEDLGLITADGFKNFTSLPKSLDPKAYL